jgi:hypothetical protein
MKVTLLSFFAVVSAVTAMAAPSLRSGLVDDAAEGNVALLVGAPNGLPGIDHDLDNAKSMVTDPAYRYDVTTLFDRQATKKALLENLTSLSEKAGEKGSFLLYFSGHGNKGIIAAAHVQIVHIREIRTALENGRKNLGPLQRLVLFFDSCNSGSLLDPVGRFLRLDPFTTSEDVADDLVRELTPTNARDSYFSKLFVFASSKASESSAGDDSGGLFTLAMKKAFSEMDENSTIGDFVKKTKSNTPSIQHPVARLVPETLSEEKMKDIAPNQNL